MSNSEMKVSDDVVVSLDYVLRLDDGDVVDQSAEGQPLQFLQGHGQIIPGLEKELYGMRVGEEKRVEVPPSEGYGEYDEEDTETMPRSAFPPDLKLEEGMGLQMRDSNSDQVYQVTVAELQDSGVVLDFNHPLAGETLFFDVRVSDLREPTEEELAHGHVH